MFCPECKSEFRPGFIRCEECDVELVDHLPPDADGSETTEYADYVVVATVRGCVEEGQICSFLEANGIPAQARGETFRKVYAIRDGPVKILVPRKFVITALDLLKKADRGELEIDAPDSETL